MKEPLELHLDRFRKPTLVVASGVLLLAIAACGGDDEGPMEPTPNPVASVTVSPEAATVPIGGSVQMTATTRDAADNILSDRPVIWSSSDSAMAKVDSIGLVTGIAPGSVTVTALSEGVTGTAAVTVVILDPSEYELVVVSGGGQSGLAGTILDEPLVVRVRNRSTGAPREAIPVQWRVVSGSTDSSVAAEVTRTSSATDVSGEASTRIILRSTGEIDVVAEVIGLDPVAFAALTALPAPSIQSISPTNADPGDTVEVRVNDLPSAAPVEVLFDGVVGEVTSRQDAAPSVLRTVVPPPAAVCAATVQSVAVRVRIGELTTESMALNVTVPPDPFQVGQVLAIEGTGDVRCAMLPAGGGTAKYLLVAMSTEFEVGGTFQVTLGGSSVAVTSAGSTSALEPRGFHDRLRAYERKLAAHGSPPAHVPSAQLFGAPPQVGDTGSFWVLNDLNAFADGELTEDEFDRVEATLGFAGAYTLLYIDDAAPQPGLTPEDIAFLGELYDRHLYNVAVDFFGEPTDLDNNDKVIVLLTPTVNGLTDRGSSNVVVGFFFGLDLFSPNTPGCSECRFSNGGEIFFGVVPDPNGGFADQRTREWVLAHLPGPMVHETQHMIDFRYKLFESSSPTVEKLWLSEGLAQAAEELAGDAINLAGDPDVADDLHAANLGNVRAYLAAPDAFSLTAISGPVSTGELGGWWLFLRWIAEQYDDFIFRELTQAPQTGVANVEGRTGESFFRLFTDYVVAIWADDLAIPGLSDRYQIPKWQLRTIFVSGSPAEYLLRPEQRTFSALRTTPETKFLAASSPFYVEVDAAGDTNALQLELTATARAGLAILRIQ